MDSNQNLDGADKLRLILDFESIDIDDLAKLLSAVRSVLFRSLLQFIRDSKRPEDSRARGWLKISYRNFARERYRNAMVFPHYRDFENDFDLMYFGEEEPPLFEEWTQYLAHDCNVEVRSITFGSYEIGIYVAGMLWLLWPDAVPNYSLVKDLTNQCVFFLRQSISTPRPRGHMESMPEIIEKLAGNTRIKKLEIHGTGETVDIKAEFAKRRK